jgi:hypothetical protein
VIKIRQYILNSAAMPTYIHAIENELLSNSHIRSWKADQTLLCQHNWFTGRVKDLQFVQTDTHMHPSLKITDTSYIHLK